ncbi:MAG: hypothetical protein V4563_17690 [Pseudomonadota bacterium]
MANRLTNPGSQHYDQQGQPLSGGLLYFYVPGSTTPKNTYTTITADIPNANPVVLLAGGLEPNIFLDGAYRVILTDRNGVQQWDRDNVNANPSVPFSDWLPTVGYGIGGINIVYASDGNYYISIDTPNIGNDPISSPLFWLSLGDYIIAGQVSVPPGEIAVGDAVTGLKGVVVDPGFVAVGNAADGLVGIDMSTKGSLLVGDGTTAPQALPAGADGFFLTADSGETTGLKYVSSPVGGLKYLSTVTAVAASTVDVETGFGATYDNYLIVANGILLSSQDVLGCRYKLGGAYITSSTYYNVSDTGGNTSATTRGVIATNAEEAINFNDFHFDCNSANKKTSKSESVGYFTTAGPGVKGDNKSLVNSGTGVKSGVRYYCDSGATITGTFYLFGIAKS